MYVKGKNRVFYQATNLDGHEVYCDFLNPKLERSEKFKMIYIGESLYYVDVWFKYTGSYVIRTFKDEVKLNHNIIQVGQGDKFIIYPDETKLI